MASKHDDSTKITVYPDHPTVSSTFKAHRSGADAAKCTTHLPLWNWIEEVATVVPRHPAGAQTPTSRDSRRTADSAADRSLRFISR